MKANTASYETRDATPRRIKLTRACCILLVACFLNAFVGIASGQPICFTDNFESAPLNPFWTTTETAGSVTFPSTVRAHGNQSVQFNSLSGAGEKYVYLRHALTQPCYGDVSVWVYDTGADQPSGNYLSLYLGAASIQAVDYNSGNGANYVYNLTGGASGNTPIPRTVGWHQFSAHSTDSTLTLAIDGTTVYSGPGGTAGTPITQIIFGMSGPTWRPAWTSYFDDFAANLIGITSGQPICFTDNFESATLNPFWTTTETAGSVTFPSTVRAHGNKSVQFNSLSGAGEKYVYLRHALTKPYYGDVSVLGVRYRRGPAIGQLLELVPGRSFDSGC